MKKSSKIAPIAQHIVPPILKTCIKKVKGLENIPKDKSFILTPNHCSYIEHFLIGSIVIPYLNRKLYYIAKKEHFDKVSQKMWHKLWMKYVPTIPIDRRKGEKALDDALSYLKKGKIILIYPEGTRSLTGKIQQGRTGVARLALGAKVPVVPLGIKGTFEILPKAKKIPKWKKAIFNFGRPMYFNEFYNKPITKKILRQITNNIMKEIARLSGQKYNF